MPVLLPVLFPALLPGSLYDHHRGQYGRRCCCQMPRDRVVQQQTGQHCQRPGQDSDQRVLPAVSPLHRCSPLYVG